ncbi:MAG: NYN domain-containing protein [Chloroflexi bacterium]|nr:NYN domain-containing protein [Chloroflexota bacterium]
MAAYLIVDVDNLLEHFRSQGILIDVQELAVGLKGGAALAAGLMSKDQLKAVAVADWSRYTSQKQRQSVDPQYVFKAAGFDTFTVQRRDSLADALIMHYFQFDPDPVDELILATTDSALMPLIRRIKTTRGARIRMWGSNDILRGTEFADQVIFQPLQTLLGIKQTKNVAVYIDFENISISLAEQGYVVNLEQLIEAFLRQARAHGVVVKMAAYAPWGTRGSLPPMVDSNGREVTEDAPNRLMQRNIDPVYSLAGKNSADMRIARDIITDSGHDDSADIYVVASGDRDFKDTIGTLRTRSKTVILWSVQGTVSRQLANNPDLILEYVEDFANLQTHQSLSLAAMQAVDDTSVTGFTPSQWSSVVLQLDRYGKENEVEAVTRKRLIDLLIEVGAVVSRPRGEDLVAQALSIGILQRASGRDRMGLNRAHPIVEKTLLIRDRIVMRVQNTLAVRNWEYVNYGFLLKGLAMDRELDRPGMNYSDQWRSDWIDCLVREMILLREIVPHRHNPDDVVPVIKLNPDYKLLAGKTMIVQPARDEDMSWEGISLPELERSEPETADMVRRIIVSVEQFTSFRNFTWCPLGSLHKRLRQFDASMNFQRAVEYLQENEAVQVKEYPNPQNEFFTKGVSLETEAPIVSTVLAERNGFILMLLYLYDRNIAIMEPSLRGQDPDNRYDLALWISIMETENVLNAVPGRPGQYSLFRTHHTVSLVADSEKSP